MSLAEILSYGITVLVIIAIVMGMMFYRIHRNRKFVANKLKCWFWPETGHKYFQFIQKEDNGIEIKAPMEHSCPRYFFNREATGWEKYPDSPPFGMKFMQVDVPAVMWAENNPEPIAPYKQTTVATSRLIDALRDEDFAAFAMEADREMKEMEKELLKARASRLNPMAIYGLLVSTMIAAIAGAAIAYQSVGAIKSIMAGMGL